MARPTEIIQTDKTTIACDGGGGAGGHPRVFLTVGEGEVLCPYCSRLYRHRRMNVEDAAD